MTSWVNTTKDPIYIEALEATESISKPAKGFILTEEAGNIAKIGPELIRQNNTIIELLVGIVKRQDVIETRLQRIENNATPATGEFQKILNSVQKGIEKIKIGETVPPTATRKVYHYIDPQKILDEVKRK